jgi:ABC-type Fe3+ transport system substrate-binding protein
MHEISRRELLKYGAAAVAGTSLMDLLAARAGAATKPTLAPPIPIATLVSKAQAEGGTCLGYFGSADIAAAMAAGFKQAYPWATLNTFVSSTGTILSKVLTEVNAKQGADFFISAFPALYVFINGGAAAPVALVKDVNLPATLRDPHGYHHCYTLNVQILVSNPNLAAYVPTDIYDLAKPQFKGALAFDRPDNLSVSAIFLASHRKEWGDKKWMTWLQGLHDNNVFVTSSATSAYQAIVAGERGICTDSIGDVLSQAPGTPAKANFYHGMPLNGQHLMLSSYAAHPYTAQLFMNWALTNAGQLAVASTNRSPAVVGLNVPTDVNHILPKGVKMAPYSNIQGFVYNTVPYTKIWDQLWPS